MRCLRTQLVHLKSTQQRDDRVRDPHAHLRQGVQLRDRRIDGAVEPPVYLLELAPFAEPPEIRTRDAGLLPSSPTNSSSQSEN